MCGIDEESSPSVRRGIHSNGSLMARLTSSMVQGVIRGQIHLSGFLSIFPLTRGPPMGPGIQSLVGRNFQKLEKEFDLQKTKASDGSYGLTC